MIILHQLSNPQAGRTLGELALCSRTGASVVGVERQGAFFSNPSPEFRFVQGDLIAVLGTPDEFEAFQKLASGP
jgi:K+/H+ antiporter YhaU regulatory subunit KhtT